MQTAPYAVEAVKSPANVMTCESIASYVQWEQERGASENALRRCKRYTASLYAWLPEDKVLTRERLLSWRNGLKELGYSSNTELNYVKGINCYLDYIGCSDLRFNRGRAKDIAGMQFGYLTAIEPTGEKNRKNIVWRCRCKCGRVVEYPATQLLTGNNLSCGCLRGDNLKAFNQYYDGTSIRMSVTEHVHSTRAESGYTGVTKKRGKWKAYIKYKGKSISLGCYSELEDAVKARARGKELVRLDAMGMLDIYEELHKDDLSRPNRAQVREMQPKPKAQPQTEQRTVATRSNNTSGYPGVFRRRDKWSARITHQKVTYQLGTFEDIAFAIAARQTAEQALRKDPAGFPEWVSQFRTAGK